MKTSREILTAGLPNVLFMLCFLAMLSSCASLAPPKVYIYSLPEKVVFAGENVSLEQNDTYSRIITWYNFFLSKPWQIDLWLQRSEMVFPFIEEKLQEHDLPLDLKYVAVAESYLSTRAISSAGAAGIWQFTASTAGAFGLHINASIDERFDYVLATEAALSYLKKGREEIGDSWNLVCASFNLGIRGVKDRMERQKSSDYWAMVFPPETEDYLPKIIAIKLIMENASSLGFRPQKGFRKVQRLKLQILEKPIYLKDIAERINLTFRDIWLLNPHIWKPYLPPGEYYFYLPQESEVKSLELSGYLDSLPYNRKIYTVSDGESLDSIAAKIGITKDELMSFNDIESSIKLDAGRQIIYWKLSS